MLGTARPAVVRMVAVAATAPPAAVNEVLICLRRELMCLPAGRRQQRSPRGIAPPRSGFSPRCHRRRCPCPQSVHRAARSSHTSRHSCLERVSSASFWVQHRHSPTGETMLTPSMAKTLSRGAEHLQFYTAERQHEECAQIACDDEDRTCSLPRLCNLALCLLGRQDRS